MRRSLLLAAAALLAMSLPLPARDVQLATFRVDVTIPLGHRCMGVLPTKSTRIVDPLEARGFVLTGLDQPVVFAVFDWCEIRNDSYDAWRRVIAEAADTTPRRVFLSCNHQHDAPVTDALAARLLEQAGLVNELFDVGFEQRKMEQVRRAVRQCLRHQTRITHIGLGTARVERIASSRRVVREDGSVEYGRGSRSGSVERYRRAPEGTIDPWLRTISFWNQSTPVAAMHVYATHPMSYYGRGEVSWDFVGMARQQMQEAFPGVFQVYATGCSGDVTAGKYNDGSPRARRELAQRLYDGMRRSWENTRRVPLKEARFRVAQLQLPFHPSERLTQHSLAQQLNDASASVESRVLAAMGLASRQRVADKRPIDVPCLDLGAAQVVLLPGESFVGYQLMAQALRPTSFVVTIGYGECWPGYIPLERDFRDGFSDKWLWVGPGSEAKMRRALQQVLVDSSPSHTQHR